MRELWRNLLRQERNQIIIKIPIYRIIIYGNDMNLRSSVEREGKTVTQIITFVGGFKKTIEGIRTDTIKQSEFCHFQTNDGKMVMVNTKNVLLIEVFKES